MVPRTVKKTRPGFPTTLSTISDLGLWDLNLERKAANSHQKDHNHKPVGNSLETQTKTRYLWETVLRPSPRPGICGTLLADGSERDKQKDRDNLFSFLKVTH